MLASACWNREGFGEDGTSDDVDGGRAAWRFVREVRYSVGGGLLGGVYDHLGC